MKTPSENVIAWLKSPLGCDGGNIDGDVWLFGLEYGGLEKSLDWINDTATFHHDYVHDDRRKDFTSKHQYDTKLTKLYTAMLGHDVRSHEEVFADTSMFGEPGRAKPSDTYKGNLYICAFPQDRNGHFTEEFQKPFDCKTKEEYKDLHRAHRFPVLRSWVHQHNPKVIVCFGSSWHYKADFIRAFHDESGDRSILRYERGEGFSLAWSLINDERTLLVIAPFLGYYAHCLNSDDRLQQAGSIIRRLAQAQFGQDWCRYAKLRLRQQLNRPGFRGGHLV